MKEKNPNKVLTCFIDYCLMFARFTVKINCWLLRKFSFYNKTTLRNFFIKIALLSVTLFEDV